jgi:hypothetical protein
MYCRHCGKEIEEKAELCVHCGRRLRSSISTWFENSELTQLKPQMTAKSPGLAGFLGFVLGWIPFVGPFGYLYLGQWNWFWLTLVICVVALPLTAGIAYVIFPFIFAFHQYQMARELNDILGATGNGKPGGGTVAPHEGGRD